MLESSIPLHTERTYTHQVLCCRITTLTFYIFNKFLKSLTLTATYELPEDDLNDDRNMLERF